MNLTGKISNNKPNLKIKKLYTKGINDTGSTK